ncbi:unnamed protein product [Brachionus calyciflorus]|uniref:RNA-directed DNA polymerase n=1 Tax=Brachionus calyciflorus TaxID=104777 RepID=A0A813WZG0_9BILA|nr:unnamed protein product [Brachionus calyciflorus]
MTDKSDSYISENSIPTILEENKDTIDALQIAIKNAIKNEYNIPLSILKDWDLEQNLPKVEEINDAENDFSDEEFSDAVEEIDPKFLSAIKALTYSLNQNKNLRIETLKYPSQNVTNWFEKFELLTNRWSNREKGSEVVSYFEEVAFQKYQLLNENKFNYEVIKKHMIKEMRPHYSSCNLIADFFSAKQKPEEDIDNFAHRLLNYIKDSSNDQKKLMEKELVSIFKRGCNKIIANFLASDRFGDFYSLWSLARTIEKNYKETEESTLNAINIENSTKTQSIPKTHLVESETNNKLRKIQCHFCGKDNHYSVNCRQMLDICNILKANKISQSSQYNNYTKFKPSSYNKSVRFADKNNSYQNNSYSRQSYNQGCDSVFKDESLNKNTNINRTKNNRKIKSSFKHLTKNFDKTFEKEIINSSSKSSTSITVRINDKEIDTLVDTGAQTSFVSFAYASKENFKREEIKNCKNWVTANGTPLEVNGQTSLEFYIGTKLVKGDFVIAKNLSSNLILGVDFLKANNCIIDFRQNLLKSGENKVELNIKNSKVICASSEITINAFDSFTYKIKIPENFIDKDIFFESSSKLNILEGYTNTPECVNLIIFNKEPFKRVIRKHTILGKFSRCEVLKSINNTEELVNIIQDDLKVDYINNIFEAKTDNKPWIPSEIINFKNTNLNKDQINELKKLIDNYSEIFSKNDEDIGTVPENFGVHDIELSENKPIRQRPYPIPYAKEQVVKECVEKMLKMNIIEPTNSSWASPIVLVKKPDGSERFCVDYRKVNGVTLKDSFPMPNIENRLNKLHGSKFFTSLDCISGYWQIKLSERAKQISSFICSLGLFSFNVMPFGLCNAGATFQRIIEILLTELSNSLAYKDDILTFSKTFEDHLEHLEKLFIKLRDAKIKVKTSKCKIAQNQTMFLGYKISGKGVEIDEDRIKTMQNHPKPKTTKQIKQFLGLVGYYRQFIPNFSDIVDPLNKLTRKNTRFKWDENCENSFKKLIEFLTSPPILAYPDFSKTFILSTDASKVGLGAVLKQKDKDNKERVIFYASRSLNKAERNYSTIERELLAIVFAVEKFKYYLYCTEFILQTDHNPLTFLNNLTLSSSRLTRWRLKLSEYNFKITYKKGNANTDADDLSRLYEIDNPENNIEVTKEDLIEQLLSISENNFDDKIKYLDKNIFESDNPIVFKNSGFNKTTNLINLAFGKLGIKLPKQFKIKPGKCLYVKNKSGKITFFLNTYKGEGILNQKSFKRSLLKLKKLCDKFNINEISFPNITNNWHHYAKLINDILINQGVNCTVFTNKETISAVNENFSISKDIENLQNKDKIIIDLKNKLQQNKLKGYILEDNVLLKLRKKKNKLFKQLVVPQILKKDILELCHDNFTGAHLGHKKTWIKLSNRFYWPNCYSEVKNYVESCEICAKIKNPPPNRAELNPITEFSKPFDMVAVDILELSTTSSGNKYVVVFTDYLTKWVEAFPLRNMTADAIAKIFINEIISRHSAPSKLLSDQGRNFLSELIKSICKYFKINKVQTAPYNPKCDGLVERFNKTLCQMLSSYSNSNQTNWDLYLPLVLFAYRTSQQSSTEETPFSLLYGREPRLGEMDNYNLGYEPSQFIQNIHEKWLEARSKIVEKAEINKKYYDKKYKLTQPIFKPNEEVRIKQPQTKINLKKKLRNDLWSDPVKIVDVLSNQNILIENKGKRKIVNINNVKKKEPDRKCFEKIRNLPTKTRSGRISIPRV